MARSFMELLASPEFDPYRPAEGTDVEDRLRNNYKAFHRAIAAADEADALVVRARFGERRASLLGQALIRVVRHHAAGRPSRALRELSRSLQRAKLAGDEAGLHANIPPDAPFAFRSRKLDHVPQLSAREMFHIPMGQSHRVGNQRFSIPGFPCLYLGSTSFCCWSELGRPPLDHLAVSAFRLRRETKVLNLALPPSWIAHQLTNGAYQDPGGAVEAYVALWPLVAACALPVRLRDQPFIPEYMVPQLLLQWSVGASAPFEGIAYISNRVPVGTFPSLATNYVFASKTGKVDAHGHFLDLLDRFDVAPPVSAPLAKLAVPTPGRPMVGLQAHEVVPFVHGIPQHYSRSPFFALDGQALAYPGAQLA